MRGSGAEEQLCNTVETVRVKFRDGSELLYGRRFPLRLKGAIYMSYVRSAILHGSEAWYLMESEMGMRDPW